KDILVLTSSDLFALKTQEVLFQIWENLFLLSGHTEKKQVPRNQHLTILKDMIHFISNHYTEKISLEEISLAGKISKTTCTHIFVKYTNQTPFSYLTEYRLKKSTELLLTTDCTISEICFEVGFSGASYFAETFKKSYHCSPSEYRSAHAVT
ncbi:MAG: AraC family transcriptional regulator, partial [Hespellia sp.]|nr:AraC family transcriptional regulator [Hespellia sp.]